MGCSNSTEAQQGGQQGGAAAVAAKPAVAKQNTANKATAKEYVQGSKAHVAENKGEERAKEWARIKEMLPRDRSDASREKREQMFSRWDVNANGMLSLAEIDKACREELALEKFTNNLQPILIRAYKATCGIHGKEADDGFIQQKEFRILFEYIVYFFELMDLFEDLDTSADRRVSREEFVRNADKLRQYGLKINDPEATFTVIDTNGGGFVLFEEFADFAAKNKIHVDAPDA